MTLPTGDQHDPRVLLGRLIERIDRTDRRIGEWTNAIHYRLEIGAREMSELRSAIVELRAHIPPRHPPPSQPEPQPVEHHRLIASLIALLREGREFIEAVASLKELALAVAILAGATAVILHPEAVATAIATYAAHGPAAPD